MDLISPRKTSHDDPFSPEWTIADLLDWIAADDGRCHEEGLAPALRSIDDALAARARRQPWTVTPAAVALVRSIAAHARDGAVRRLTLATLLGHEAGSRRAA